jgi:hypothetical protein
MALQYLLLFSSWFFYIASRHLSLLESMLQVAVTHGDRCVAYHEVHTNYADESASLMANSIWNKGK